jgi:hypothetical protein
VTLKDIQKHYDKLLKEFDKDKPLADEAEGNKLIEQFFNKPLK